MYHLLLYIHCSHHNQLKGLVQCQHGPWATYSKCIYLCVFVVWQRLPSPSGTRAMMHTSHRTMDPPLLWNDASRRRGPAATSSKTMRVSTILLQSIFFLELLIHNFQYYEQEHIPTSPISTPTACIIFGGGNNLYMNINWYCYWKSNDNDRIIMSTIE